MFMMKLSIFNRTFVVISSMYLLDTSLTGKIRHKGNFSSKVHVYIESFPSPRLVTIPEFNEPNQFYYVPHSSIHTFPKAYHYNIK